MPISQSMNAGSRPPSDRARRTALAVLVRASEEELAGAFDEIAEIAPAPAFETVRRPETGLVMVSGRIGGGGAPFNVGEVTVTRCVVRLASGEVGFGHVLGRDAARAELVARFDALLQSERYCGIVEEKVLKPVAGRIRDEDELTRRQTAATRVNFFTMVRGEDE
jgi:alpha-D-ribose 1-methylphosphonate 5-triphosphate synthase subunit PhnG